ncbi:MAG: hypothetical protein JRN66_08650 [Nitrososphaerota archaeon]|nr:hypothetical protein [Nitrososphaerota archaeon]
MKTQRGEASIIGALFIIALIVISVMAISSITNSEISYTTSNGKINQIQNLKGEERAVVSYSSSTGVVTINDTGSTSLIITDLIQVSSSGAVSTNTESVTLQPGASTTVTVTTGLSRVGVVSSYGNVFWWLSTSGSLTPAVVTFEAPAAVGATGTILTVDGTNYGASALPLTFSWPVGTTHTYSYTSEAPAGTGTRIAFQEVTGMASAQSGTIVAKSAGVINAVYTMQYLLTVAGGSGVSVVPTSPTGDGYYNSGTIVTVSSAYSWATTSITRQNLYSYTVNSVVFGVVPRLGSGTFSTSVTMDSPKTFAFNSVTQYYIGQLVAGSAISCTVPSQTGDNWCDQSTVSVPVRIKSFQSDGSSVSVALCAGCMVVVYTSYEIYVVNSGGATTSTHDSDGYFSTNSPQIGQASSQAVLVAGGTVYMYLAYTTGYYFTSPSTTSDTFYFSVSKSGGATIESQNIEVYVVAGVNTLTSSDHNTNFCSNPAPYTCSLSPSISYSSPSFLTGAGLQCLQSSSGISCSIQNNTPGFSYETVSEYELPTSSGSSDFSLSTASSIVSGTTANQGIVGAAFTQVLPS